MVRNRLGDALIGGGRHDDAPASHVFVAQKGQQVLIVRQMCGVKGPSFGNLVLEVCAAPRQPERQAKQIAPIGEGRRNCRLEQRIDLQQRTVQIDAERQRVDFRQCLREVMSQLDRCV